MEKCLKYPSQELPFKDIIANETWQNDDVFTQQRLAGLNPMSLRKMKSVGKGNESIISIQLLIYRDTVNAYFFKSLINIM